LLDVLPGKSLGLFTIGGKHLGIVQRMRHLGHLLVVLVADDDGKGAVVVVGYHRNVLVYASIYCLGYIGLGVLCIAVTQIDLQGGGD